LSRYFDFQPLLQNMAADAQLAKWALALPEQLNQFFFDRKHGDIARWIRALDAMPEFAPSAIELNASAITVAPPAIWSDEQHEQMRQALQGLHPWRKGPFDIGGVYVDTEWRSDWKWERVLPGISPLEGRKVLDIGCGSGYHCWRMAGEGAKMVVGVEPSLLFLCQFAALQRYIQAPNVNILPIGVQHIPPQLKAFDTTFSMGVFYHRSAPFEHLAQLKDTLREGGELVLETLVVEGDIGQVLVPEDRYASMNNVWFLPSCPTLESWLKKAGFSDIRLVNVDRTSLEEQRSTDWMRFYSLANYLDPDDPSRTIEGHPAPLRATFVATA
jgi:tRNA (mo5U34)-methyltransferase